MVDRYSDDDDDGNNNNKDQPYEKVVNYFPAVATEGNVSGSVPTSVEFDTSKKATTSSDLQSELELARKEIAELKKQLSDIAAGRQALTD